MGECLAACADRIRTKFELKIVLPYIIEFPLPMVKSRENMI